MRLAHTASAIALVILCLPAMSLSAAARDFDPGADLPAGVTPVGEETAARLQELLAETERLRGLEALTPLVAGHQSRSGAKATFQAELEADVPAETLASIQRALVLFGLLPEELELGPYLVDLMGSQIAGYYDPEEDYLAIVGSETDWLDPTVVGALGEEAGGKLASSLWVHEIGHALQDQHFDLGELTSQTLLSDPALARSALIEGDATLVMYSFLAGIGLERMPGGDQMLSRVAADPAEVMAAVPDQPGVRELLAAPAYLRENLLFSYFGGLSFCLRLRQEGGQKLLDHAFRDDPPASSEQILHPEKYLGERDDPVEIEMPDLAEAFGREHTVFEDSLGELNVRLVLAERLGQAGRETATIAAAGWGGDRFALYRAKRRELLAWITEWDDPTEAEEFYVAARSAFPDWRPRLAGTRVTLLHTRRLGSKATAAVAAALADARAVRPERPPLDLAALGIGDDDRPAPLDFEEMLVMYSDPVVGRLVNDSLESLDPSVFGLGDDPEIHEAFRELMRELTKGGERDIASVLESDAMVEFQQKILSTEVPAGESRDGWFAVEDAGFSVRLPTGDAWIDATDQLPATDGGGPILLLVDQETGAAVVVTLIKLPMPSTIEHLAIGIQAAESLPGQKTLRSGFLGQGPNRAFEIELVGLGPDEIETRLVSRTLVAGEYAVSVQVSVAAADWDERSAALLGVLASVAIE